ncbi:MAG: FkbM family methyltransferase [Synechococcales bacterium]|nr:FkbM family methyltransferase [Synechococcales bacterium]
MSKLKGSLKQIIKAVSGYNFERRGRGRSSYLAFARDNIDMKVFYAESLLLTDQTKEEVIRTKGVYDYLQQLRLKTILDTYQINTVLDVGANMGQFARDLRRTGYQGKIISFEPLSTTFEELKNASAGDPNWDTYQLALGKENGKQQIHVADSSVFTSFLKANAWCEERFGASSVGSREETVTVRRLDEVLGEMVDNLEQARIYLKMDTQGYDLEVFKGLGHLTDPILALQTEVSVIPIYQGMPPLIDSLTFFEKAGFELAGMYPVSFEHATLRVIEFDCMMVRASD